MSKPLVSISCITFNHAMFIRDCIESLLMQKTNFSYEILIHDDASTDNTESIIREYQLQYPDIIKPLYEFENQWIKGRRGSKVFNFPRATGKYIAFCEGDDYWIDPLKLQKQVDFLESNPDYVLCGHNAIQLIQGKEQKVRLFNNITTDSDLNINQVVTEWIVPTASILVRKDIALFDPDWCTQIYSGDFRLLLLAAYQGKIRILSDIMSVYRSVENGSSVSNLTSNQPVFVWNEHIKLLKSFNQGTNRVFSDVIDSRIEYLENEIKFHILKDRSWIITFVLMPGLFIKKIYRKFH